MHADAYMLSLFLLLIPRNKIDEMSAKARVMQCTGTIRAIKCTLHHIYFHHVRFSWDAHKYLRCDTSTKRRCMLIHKYFRRVRISWESTDAIAERMHMFVHMCALHVKALWKAQADWRQT